MLRSFRFSNHRSFRDEAELLLLPAYDKERSAVPVAAIYGANAAGKSNVLDALAFMAEAVRNSYGVWRPEHGIPRRPFALPRHDSASTYVVELVLDGTRHTYGFTVDDERVREEWLYSYAVRSRRRIVFERELDQVSLGSTITNRRAKAELLTELTRSNALFLSLATQLGVEAVLPVDRWFAEGLVFAGIRPGSPALDRVVIDYLSHEPAGGQRLINLLQAADLGVSGVVVQDRSAGADQADSRYWEAERTLRDLGPAGRGTADGARAIEAFNNAVSALGTRPQVLLAHGPEGHLLEMSDESAGTRTWLRLLPTLIGALDSGRTLVVDEIDGSLHPELVARLVYLFQSDNLNPHAAQLVFTTHDTTLLAMNAGEEVLGRDQVWFTEKDAEGRSTLYPLTDFRPRKNENRERRYLSGSYGAIPITSDSAVERALSRSGNDDVAAS